MTLKVPDYEALVSAAEDAEDRSVLLAEGAREEVVGRADARADHLADDLVGRLCDGEHPVTVWREHRGLSLPDLAGRAQLAVDDLTEIESGKEQGSIADYRGLAAALDVTVDDLIPI